MRRVVVVVVGAALIAAGAIVVIRGGTPKPQLSVSPVHSSGRTCASSNCGTYSASLSWTEIHWPHTTTGYYLFVNGKRVAKAVRSPYSFSGLDCGATFILGVEAHDQVGNVSTLYETRFTPPSSQKCTVKVLALCPSGARCFYVDYASGSDANSGTSEASPWQHAPGMQGCSSRCASTTPQADDYYILKGGVTWPNAALPWVWQWSGNASHGIYLGVDPSWFTGSSWSRPILNGGAASIPGVATNHDQVNEFLDMSSTQYVTVDDFEFTGARWSTTSQGGNIYLNANEGLYDLIEHNYFHGWSNGCSGSAGCDPGIAISATYTNASVPPNNPGTIEYNVIDGSDTPEVEADPNCTSGCKGSLRSVWAAEGDVAYNIMDNVSNGYVGGAAAFHDNLVENIRDSIDPTNHENGFENNGDPECGALVYNNVIRNTSPANPVTFWIVPRNVPSSSPDTCTDYVFNNVMYNIGDANMWDLGPSLQSGQTADGRVMAFNNTFELGADSESRPDRRAALSSPPARTTRRTVWAPTPTTSAPTTTTSSSHRPRTCSTRH